MQRVLVTGSQGFVGTYIVAELLNRGYQVIGVDNFSKYGRVQRPHDNRPFFTLFEHDLKRGVPLVGNVDYIIANAAMIGGISYFHKYAYDLLATNERIIAATYDFAITNHIVGDLKRVVVISSSMVFEQTKTYPTPESEVCPPPLSSYGFQKLACEYFAKAAHQQYGVPYTIIRPFNCVGVGEMEAKSGNEKMMLSHVVPDLVSRAMTLGPTGKLPILGSGEQIRNYTNGRDIANAIVTAMESRAALNEDFNISSPVSYTVKEVAKLIYKVLYGTDEVEFEHLKPFEHDVQCRIPDVNKAKMLLGVSCDIPLETSIREIVEWLKK